MYLLKTILFYFYASFIFATNAHILEGLKDAVINAEGIFGDVVRSVNSVAQHLQFSNDVWKDAVEEECLFSCADGTLPKKNKYHVPTSNGCGLPGLKIDTEYLSLNDMTRCCDQHDICYGTCNKNKDKCDQDFKKCLYKQCDNSNRKKTEAMLTGCKTAAKLLYTGTMMFGCKFYKSAQKEACYCPPSHNEL